MIMNDAHFIENMIMFHECLFLAMVCNNLRPKLFVFLSCQESTKFGWQGANIIMIRITFT